MVTPPAPAAVPATRSNAVSAPTRRLLRIMLQSLARVRALPGPVPHEPSLLHLGTDVWMLQAQRLPRHRPERLAHRAPGVGPVEPRLPPDHPMHAEAVRQIGTHRVESRVDRPPRILELDLEEVLLRKAVADAQVVEPSVTRTPLGHRSLDARDHVLEALSVRLAEPQPAVDAAA